MIKIINKEIDALIALLNEKHPEGPDVFLHIIEDCDTIDNGQGVGFGVYNTETMEIYVAGDLPEPEAVLHTIAHEFAHHLQNKSGEGYDEEYADEFAAAILEELEERTKVAEPKENKDIISIRIKEALKARNMTQRELAEATGITEVTISRYASSTRIPRGTEIVKIASALNVTCDYILGLKDNLHEKEI